MSSLEALQNLYNEVKALETQTETKTETHAQTHAHAHKQTVTDTEAFIDDVCWAVSFRDQNGNRIKLCAEHGFVINTQTQTQANAKDKDKDKDAHTNNNKNKNSGVLRVPIDLSGPQAADRVRAMTEALFRAIPVCVFRFCFSLLFVSLFFSLIVFAWCRAQSRCQCGARERCANGAAIRWR